jgi:hypothetical protein
MMKAQATVDRFVFPSGMPSKSMWKVYVSDPSHEHRRDYTIIADDEDAAAKEGLRRFQAELDPEPHLDV